jgi:hypothetical protein
MENLDKKPTESTAGGRVYPALVLAACLSLFLITVSLRFDRVLLCAVDHLLL